MPTKKILSEMELIRENVGRRIYEDGRKRGMSFLYIGSLFKFWVKALAYEISCVYSIPLSLRCAVFVNKTKKT